MILINFERNPDYKAIFKTLIPAEIIEWITLFIAQKTVPGKSPFFGLPYPLFINFYRIGAQFFPGGEVLPVGIKVISSWADLIKKRLSLWTITRKNT
jgi:hypothetical protein